MELEQFLLTLLYKFGGRVEGKTRIQKLTFLGIKEYKMPIDAHYYWHNYGPFSVDVERAMEELEIRSLVRINDEDRTSFVGDPYTIRTFELTNEGRVAAVNFIKEMSPKEYAKIVRLIKGFGYSSLQDILQYVYQNYSSDELED